MFGYGTHLNSHDAWSKQGKYKYDPFSDNLSVWDLQIWV